MEMIHIREHVRLQLAGDEHLVLNHGTLKEVKAEGGQVLGEMKGIEGATQVTHEPMIRTLNLPWNPDPISC